MKDAKTLARIVLGERLAACAKFIPVSSSYWWDDEIVEEDEVLLLLQTSKQNVRKLIAWMKKNHPYDTPEIVEIQMGKGNDAFFKWISEVTKGD
jgi:periplasmic divalent cation tolerance protein